MPARFFLTALFLLLFAASGFAATEFSVLCYHDVRDGADAAGDPMAVTTSRLVAHFEWLKENGYTPVSLDDIAAAAAGEKPLPEKPVLLTFDDGLKSLYTRVFPLLKLFRYPAVASVVGSWLEAGPDWTLGYGPGTLRRADFVSWEELREMQDSGLLEVASHSWNLHRGISGNPLENEQPAAVTRRYEPATGSYENETAWEIRLRYDLHRSAALMEERLGRRPRAIVWPYGAHNALAEGIARELGMVISFGLDSRRNPLPNLHNLGRFLMVDNPDLSALALEIEGPRPKAPIRVAQVDLDYVYDPDPLQQERNLDLLLDRIKAMGVTTVYLQAFADPEGDGTASELYFPNRHLPMRADLFNRVAWQLRTRTGVAVFAWLPVLAFDLPGPGETDRLAVDVWRDGKPVPSPIQPRRLSPYKPEARRIIGDIYEDLARQAAFQGILFHDDAILDSGEDAAALKGGKIPSHREKTLALIRFTDELTDRVRAWRPGVSTARNLFARVVLEPRSEEWFAQNLELFLASYEQTALMAMPYMEKAENPEEWLVSLTEAVARIPGGLDKTVFELQTRDWRTGRPIPTDKLTEQVRLLLARGAVNLGYYPDDFHTNHPNLEGLRSVFSTETHPYRRR